MLRDYERETINIMKNETLLARLDKIINLKPDYAWPEEYVRQVRELARLAKMDYYGVTEQDLYDTKPDQWSPNQ